MNEFLLPHEILNRVGVPNDMRHHVAYRVLAAKYCALVEAVMKVTDGEPVRMSLKRAQEINAMEPLKTDAREMVMVLENPAEDGDVLVRLATVAEVQAANRHYALSQMGARRN